MSSESERLKACSTCRSGKRKCDGTRPTCRRCTQKGRNCVYTFKLTTFRTRPRSINICSMCRHQKLKCDGTKPVCRRCTRMGTECAYPSNNTARVQETINILNNQTMESTARAQETINTLNNQTIESTAQVQETINTLNNQTIESTAQAQETINTFKNGMMESIALARATINTFNNEMMETIARAQGTIKWTSNSPRNPKPEQSSNQFDPTMTCTGGHNSGTQIAHQEAKQTEGSSIEFPNALPYKASGRGSPMDPFLDHVNRQPDTMIVQNSPLGVRTTTMRNSPSDHIADIPYRASNRLETTPTLVRGVIDITQDGGYPYNQREHQPTLDNGAFEALYWQAPQGPIGLGPIDGNGITSDDYNSACSHFPRFDTMPYYSIGSGDLYYI